MTTRENLRNELDYNPATGVFRWKRSWRGRNRNGGLAGTSVNGYWAINIDGRRFFAHRLAWFYMTGEWPPHDIDHIDGNPANNAFANLRLATRAENLGNSRLRKDNPVGLKGVIPKTQCGHTKYHARIRVDGEQRHLGSFDTPEEAHAAYVAKAAEVFGEFARAA